MTRLFVAATVCAAAGACTPQGADTAKFMSKECDGNFSKNDIIGKFKESSAVYIAQKCSSGYCFVESLKDDLRLNYKVGESVDASSNQPGDRLLVFVGKGENKQDVLVIFEDCVYALGAKLGDVERIVIDNDVR